MINWESLYESFTEKARRVTDWRYIGRSDFALAARYYQASTYCIKRIGRDVKLK